MEPGVELGGRGGAFFQGDEEGVVAFVVPHDVGLADEDLPEGGRDGGFVVAAWSLGGGDGGGDGDRSRD